MSGLRVLLQVASPLLLVVALVITEGDSSSGYGTYPAWAVFATVAAVLQLASLVAPLIGVSARTGWTIAAAATAALVGYWIVIVLPGVSSNVGFLQTMAVACAVLGCWLSPDRRL